MFDLAITCFTRCRKIFKKFVFLASPKTRVVTAGQGERVAHGEAMHMMDWMEMQRWWRELGEGTTALATRGRLGSGRGESERGRARE